MCYVKKFSGGYTPGPPFTRGGRGGWGGPRKRREGEGRGEEGKGKRGGKEGGEGQGEGKGGRNLAPHSEILDPPEFFVAFLDLLHIYLVQQK
jgi:hypothetical protein